LGCVRAALPACRQPDRQNRQRSLFHLLGIVFRSTGRKNDTQKGKLIMIRRAISILLTLLLLLLCVRPAEAHANLVRSEPAAGALLDAAPKELVLEFSEELDPGFSRVQLYNSKNQVINAGPGVIDPAVPMIMRLALGDLPKDSYTALLRVRSAVDGHISEGSVPFGVGVAATATSLIPAPGTPDPATETPPPLDAVARWLNLLVAAVSFGGLSFALLVWRPAYLRMTKDERRTTNDDSGDGGLAIGDRKTPAPNRQSPIADRSQEAADDAMTQTLRRLIMLGGALFLLTNVLFLLTQAADAVGVPVLQAIGAPAFQLLSSRSGQLLLARAGLTILIVAVAWRLPPAGRGPAWPWWIALALAGGVVLSFSLNAHGAAEERGATLAITLDWLHVAAMIAWLGGLLPLLLAIQVGRRTPEQALPLALLIPRFSWLAASCVVVLTLTGIYSYFLHINRLDLLAATSYGRALLVKLGLFGLLFLLGAVNLLLFSPRLRSAGNRLARAFGRSVRAELVFGTLLLIAVGAMTSVAPSQNAWDAHERLGLSQAASEGDVDLVLRVAPAQIGDNEWAVDVTDRRPGAQAAPAKVLLRFDMLGMSMGKLQADTQTTDEERYTARGSFTSMGGRWHVEVVLRRAGFDDITHTFQLDIVRSALPEL
jgi:copper transport protein